MGALLVSEANRMQDLLTKLEYREGKLYWTETVNARAVKGSEAGWVDGRGYRCVRFKHKLYLTHRLIFLMHHGDLPETLDHINQDILDNHINNLRVANKSQNAANQKIRSTNTSGYKGVSLNRITGKWSASICVNNKQARLGSFRTAELAAQAYNEKATEVFGEYASLNTIPT